MRSTSIIGNSIIVMECAEFASTEIIVFLPWESLHLLAYPSAPPGPELYHSPTIDGPVGITRANLTPCSYLRCSDKPASEG